MIKFEWIEMIQFEWIDPKGMDLYIWDGFVYLDWIEPLGVDSDLEIWFQFPSCFCEFVFFLDFVLGNAFINPYAHCKQGNPPG